MAKEVRNIKLDSTFETFKELTESHGIGHHNFCRMPDKTGLLSDTDHKKPWCYTTGHQEIKLTGDSAQYAPREEVCTLDAATGKSNADTGGDLDAFKGENFSCVSFLVACSLLSASCCCLPLLSHVFTC